MIGRCIAAFMASFLAAASWASSSAPAQGALACGPFTSDVIAGPEPREARWPVGEFEKINEAVKTQPYQVLFFGDSLTERFDEGVWRQHMAPRRVLNAGVSGDRTEHLLWRLQHGNLAGPPPEAVLVLIGTNDVGAGRTPEDIAEGIRANLLYLRRHRPDARIGLLGLWPRDEWPEARFRRAAVAVNQLIRKCADNRAILYADIGGVLLDAAGRLDPAISPDHLHFTGSGYIRLVPRLDRLIDRLVSGR